MIHPINDNKHLIPINNLPDALPIDFNQYINQLNIANNLINSTNANSEKEFLEIGSKLQKYMSGTRQLSIDASSTASVLSERILNNGINELSSLLNQFSRYLSDSAKNIRLDREELLVIYSKVNLIINELGGFKRIVKNLRMLGIATKIESARLGTDDNGFVALADNVDNLSSMISDKADSIYRKATSLLGEINVTTSDLEKLERKNQQQSDLIIVNTTNSLKIFEKKYNDCLLKVEHVSQNSNNVNNSISEIVTSIQFHDITRQQLEHVREALEEVIYKQKNEIDDYNRAALIYDICELQTGQIKNSLHEFDSAVDSIIDNLAEVEKNITNIYNEISDLLDKGNLSGQSSLKEIEKELSTISAGLLKNKDISDDLAKSIKSVVSVLDDLAAYVLQIEDIGTEIEIIALNARVKAARTGTNGAALGVLAEAIQKLSLEAKNQTVSTNNVLNSISDASKNLKNNVELNSSGAAQNNISADSNKINNLLSSLIDLENDTGIRIEKLGSAVNALKLDINKTIDGITIQNNVRSAVANVIGHLDDVTISLKSKAGLKENRIKNTGNLMNKYTMQSERKIHNRFSEGKKSFNDNKPGLNHDENDSLGDNVELF